MVVNAAGIGPLPQAVAAPQDKTEQKTIGAAKDFEALLIGQMLKSMRDEKSGWLGSSDDSDDDSNDTMLSVGEQQIAQVLTNGGGLGLASVVAAGLRQKSGADH
jgi:Rod binding domain-containing protein